VERDLRAELLRRAERDQAARNDDDMDAMEAVDAENLAWLKDLIARAGWPGRSAVGDDGAGAAWLLVQHAGRDPSVLSCPRCTSPVEMWLPEPGQEATKDCPGCGYTMWVKVGEPSRQDLT